MPGRRGLERENGGGFKVKMKMKGTRLSLPLSRRTKAHKAVFESCSLRRVDLRSDGVAATLGQAIVRFVLRLLE